MQPTPGEPSGRMLLELREREWRPLLNGVSLIAEAEVTPEETHPVVAALGHVHSSHFRDPHEDKILAFRRWPACLAISLAGVAATHYERNTYWPALWSLAGYAGSAQDEKVWGTAFTRALGMIDLPSFPEPHRPHLGSILMHAGIPSHSLGDLLRLLLQQTRRDPGLDADSFMAWATAGTSRLATLDVPVRRFLSSGGDYAFDTLDRLLELLVRLRAPVPDLSGVGLPARLVEEARTLADKRFPGPSVPAPHTDRAGKPRLGLDPFGEGLVLVLPTAGDGDNWRIVADGELHIVNAEPGWQDEDIGHITFPLREKVRQIQVSRDSLHGAGQDVEMRVLDEDDPLLVFSEDGRWLPAPRSLPRDVVWTLYPADRRLACEGDMNVVCEGSAPSGWQGWVLEEIDLSRAVFIGLEGCRPRQVRGSDQPHLVLGEPLTGITGPHGAPVFGDAPGIWLPDGGSGTRPWQIQIRIPGASTPLAQLAVSGGQVDPWAAADRPVIGTFEITILGPLGSRLHRCVTVAEGLDVSYEPEVRVLTARGIAPGRTRFRGRGLAEPSEIAFDEHTRRAPFRFGKLQLHVTPPHFQVLHEDGTLGARWNSAPLALSMEFLSDPFSRPGALLIHGPECGAPLVLQVIHGQDTIQTVPSGRALDPGQARFELARIKDTVGAHRSVDLVLRAGSYQMPVAAIRPRATATAAVLRGDQVQLQDYVPVPGLQAGVYQVLAPWRPPQILPVSDRGIAVLPGSPATAAGPLRLLLRAENEQGGWPAWPDPERSLHCSAPGVPDSPDAAEYDLSWFAAGAAPLPEAPDQERLWVLCAQAHQLEGDGAREDLGRQCRLYLRNDPAAALLALPATRLSPAECVTEVVASGLAALQPRFSPEPSATRALWAAFPAPASFVAGRLLADREALPTLVETAIAQCGPEVTALLVDCVDPWKTLCDGTAISGSGSGSRADSPGLFERARIATMFAGADRLSRSGTADDLLEQADGIVADAAVLLAATRYAKIAERLGSRPHGLLQMSAALAIVARAAAWGKTGECKRFERLHRPIWTRLARLLPELVSIDLVLAQALTARTERALLLKEDT